MLRETDAAAPGRGRLATPSGPTTADAALAVRDSGGCGTPLLALCFGVELANGARKVAAALAVAPRGAVGAARCWRRGVGGSASSDSFLNTPGPFASPKASALDL